MSDDPERRLSAALIGIADVPDGEQVCQLRAPNWHSCKFGLFPQADAIRSWHRPNEKVVRIPSGPPTAAVRRRDLPTSRSGYASVSHGDGRVHLGVRCKGGLLPKVVMRPLTDDCESGHRIVAPTTLKKRTARIGSLRKPKLIYAARLIASVQKRSTVGQIRLTDDEGYCH